MQKVSLNKGQSPKNSKPDSKYSTYKQISQTTSDLFSLSLVSEYELTQLVNSNQKKKKINCPCYMSFLARMGLGSAFALANNSLVFLLDLQSMTIVLNCTSRIQTRYEAVRVQITYFNVICHFSAFMIGWYFWMVSRKSQQKMEFGRDIVQNTYIYIT